MKQRRIVSLLLCLVLLSVSILSSCDQSSTETQTQGETQTEGETNMNTTPSLPQIDLTTLRQTGARSQRWLSVPSSRLVINPYNINVDVNTTETQYSDRPTLPLNIGFLTPYTANDWGEFLEDLVTIYEKGDADGDIESFFQANLNSNTGWTCSGGNFIDFKAADGKMSLTVKKGANTPWQFAAQLIDIDLSKNPILTVTVDNPGGSWALKLCETGKEDVSIISDTARTGTITADLSKILNRTDRFKGQLKLYEIGYDQTLTISRLDIQSVTVQNECASSYTTAWNPSFLEFTGTYPNGMEIEGTDTFSDEFTVVRTIKVKKGGKLVLGGKLTGTDVSLMNGNKVLVYCDRYSYILSLSQGAKPEFYKDLNAFLADVDGEETPVGDEQYVGWVINNAKENDEYTLYVTMASDAVKDSELIKKNADAAKQTSVELIEKWNQYWTNYLDLVPRPTSFTLEAISKYKVTAANIEQHYYIAWIFLAQNILAPNPELDYPYAQICCGKPSLWASGAHQSAYSASWESFFGIQLLGYVMPDVAWDALAGMISLVDETGLLGGESLPSEKAHSAWVLYELTGDKDKLAALYEGIERYLNWRIDNPRWIYKDTNDVNSADADFVVSALIDIEYMEKIAAILGKDADVPAWNAKHAALLKNYYKWNFDSAGNVYQYCNKVNLSRSGGCTIWTTKGLMIEGLDKQHANYLLKRFMTEYDKNKTLAGLGGVKYPELSQAVLGLNKIGETSKALVLAEMCVREMVRFGMFSENYLNYESPVGSGVRPAMFGCAQMIDGVLMLNGFSYQTVSSIDLGRKSGSVTNVLINGEKCSFSTQD